MPTSKTLFPFPIDGAFHPVFLGPVKAQWTSAAERKGFSLIGRAVDRLHVVLGCHTCGQPTLKRINVVRDHAPECPHCIAARRAEAARKMGARLIAPDPQGDRHYGVYEFACGHTGRRQHHRVERAAAGGHGLGCETCTEARHAAEAEARDWQLIGRARRRHPGYRRYAHTCGHRQDVAVANMRHGDVDCAGCGESWASKPSQIYLFDFTLPDLPVVKLGFSSNPSFRLRQVQRDPGQTQGKLLRAIPIESGHRAICIEKALHAHIRAHCPDLIVPPALFRGPIRTTSEIYHHHARSYIQALLEAVAAGWDPSASGSPDNAAA
ncbi:hypothetical protein [Jhaorihella thermophila]|uniref:Uncharacterized protein n=1 Tax=Jhaorihella thermophila TaxID=488547 RepID=A0A1H5ZMN3_9RHOB|nr:hypothetical protein [Jhaorihella thermophila]SEG37461.1 hypothetical protein SAMN05421751_1552 [Jhaorihella thermophila]